MLLNAIRAISLTRRDAHLASQSEVTCQLISKTKWELSYAYLRIPAIFSGHMYVHIHKHIMEIKIYV